MQALLWEFNNLTRETVGSALFEGPVTTLPFGPIMGDYAAVVTTLPAPVDLDPSKYGMRYW